MVDDPKRKKLEPKLGAFGSPTATASAPPPVSFSPGEGAVSPVPAPSAPTNVFQVAPSEERQAVPAANPVAQPRPRPQRPVVVPTAVVPPQPEPIAAPKRQPSRDSQPPEPGEQPDPAPKRHLLQNWAIWLSGAGPEMLQQCRDSEHRKHGALGYTVLVPTVFALMACSYAVSTLTDNVAVIAIIAMAWAAIIMFIDRALLATYRTSMESQQKVAQFLLRMGIAVLMGLTIAHPLTLLLFKDTIRAEIEGQKDLEVEGVRKSFLANRNKLEARITIMDSDIQLRRQEHTKSYEADFLTETDTAGSAMVTPQLAETDRTAMEQQIAAAVTPLEEQITELDLRLETHEIRKKELQDELTHWQQEFEAEVGGARSGFAGVGPRARSIQTDQIAWRRDDVGLITKEMSAIKSHRSQLEQDILKSERGFQANYQEIALARAEEQQAEKERVAAMQQKVQERQMHSFMNQQDDVRDQIGAQIASNLEELARLRGELDSLSAEEQARVDVIRTKPREDLLTQTLALHHLFANREAGGHFALLAYLVLAGLFLAVDTMPILIKFTTKSGEYDAKVDLSHNQEVILSEGHLAEILGSRKELAKAQLEVEKEEYKLKRFRKDPDTYLEEGPRPLTAFDAPTQEDVA